MAGTKCAPAQVKRQKSKGKNSVTSQMALCSSYRDQTRPGGPDKTGLPCSRTNCINCSVCINCINCVNRRKVEVLLE